MTTLNPEQLDPGELTIWVLYSSIHYKDALAATGAGKIIRRFPRAGAVDNVGGPILHWLLATDLEPRDLAEMTGRSPSTSCRARSTTSSSGARRGIRS